jgi:hypothetical protein
MRTLPSNFISKLCLPQRYYRREGAASSRRRANYTLPEGAVYMDGVNKLTTRTFSHYLSATPDNFAALASKGIVA